MHCGSRYCSEVRCQSESRTCRKSTFPPQFAALVESLTNYQMRGSYGKIGRNSIHFAIDSIIVLSLFNMTHSIIRVSREPPSIRSAHSESNALDHSKYYLIVVFDYGADSILLAAEASELRVSSFEFPRLPISFYRVSEAA